MTGPSNNQKSKGPGTVNMISAQQSSGEVCSYITGWQVRGDWYVGAVYRYRGSSDPHLTASRMG